MIDLHTALHAATGVILALALIVIAGVFMHGYAPHVPTEVAAASVCIDYGSEYHSCE